VVVVCGVMSRNPPCPGINSIAKFVETNLPTTTIVEESSGIEGLTDATSRFVVNGTTLAGSMDDNVFIDCEGKYAFIDGCNVLHKLVTIDKICFSKSVPILRENTERFISFLRSNGIIPCVVFDGYRSSDETVEKLQSRRKQKILEGKRGIPYAINTTFNDILLELGVCTFTSHDCDADDVIAAFINEYPDSYLFSADNDYLMYDYENKPQIIYNFYFNYRERNYKFFKNDRPFLIDQKQEESDQSEIRIINKDLIRDSGGNLIEIKVHDDIDPIEFANDKKICQRSACECILKKHKDWRMGQSYIGVKLMGNNRKNTLKLRQAIYWKIFGEEREGVTVKESYFDWDFEKDDLVFFESDVSPDKEFLEDLINNPKKCLDICFPVEYIADMEDKFKKKFGENDYYRFFLSEMYSIYSSVYYYHTIVSRNSFPDVIFNAFNRIKNCSECNIPRTFNILSRPSDDDFVYTCFDCKKKERGVCKNWKNGYCSRSNCMFYHDPNINFNRICFHYKKGKCYSGDKCMYSHKKFERKGGKKGKY
jgi:hypothetical protein